jgi:hypothetical protein
VKEWVFIMAESLKDVKVAILAKYFDKAYPSFVGCDVVDYYNEIVKRIKDSDFQLMKSVYGVEYWSLDEKKPAKYARQIADKFVSENKILDGNDENILKSIKKVCQYAMGISSHYRVLNFRFTRGNKITKCSVNFDNNIELESNSVSLPFIRLNPMNPSTFMRIECDRYVFSLQRTPKNLGELLYITVSLWDKQNKCYYKTLDEEFRRLFDDTRRI